MEITEILIGPKEIDYLIKRNLDKQYKKAKALILSGNLKIVDFKIRQPKSAGLYYFRINKQYRALAKRNNKTLYIISIDNHQN